MNLDAIALGAIEANQDKEKAFVCQAVVNLADRAIPVSIIVDSGAEVCFVNQRWAKQYLPDSQAMPRTAWAINEQTVRSFGAHQMTLEITDSAGTVREDPVTCEAVEIQGYDLILGYDWLTSVNLDINYKEHTWSYRDKEPTRILRVSAAVCYNEAALGALLIIVYPRPSDENGPVLFFHAVSDDGKTIPEAYRDFENIFDEKDAGKLPQSTHLDHAIELQEGTQPPHQPIYPFPKRTGGFEKIYRQHACQGLDPSISKPCGCADHFC